MSRGIKDELKKFFGEEGNEPPIDDEDFIIDDANESNDDDAPFDLEDVMGDCVTCDRDTKELMKRDVLNFHSKYDKLLAEEYCKGHEAKYSEHKCKPHWCGDCGYLEKYVVDIDHDKKE